MIDQDALKLCFIPCPNCGEQIIGWSFDCFYCGESLDIIQQTPEDMGDNQELAA